MTTADTLPDSWPITQLVAQLNAHRDDLARRYQIATLGVFGSYVRNEQTQGSDLDVLITFARTPSLFEFIALQHELSDLLGVPVDLVMRSALKPHIGRTILHEVVEL